jgi:hypothetical protein
MGHNNNNKLINKYCDPNRNYYISVKTVAITGRSIVYLVYCLLLYCFGKLCPGTSRSQTLCLDFWDPGFASTACCLVQIVEYDVMNV